MRDRIESILIQIAQQEARHLLTQMPQAGHRVPYLADHLAKEGILVMRGNLPQRWQAQAQPLIMRWMELHQDIYDALAGMLFPAYTARGWMDVGRSIPAITLLDGECRILIEMHAQYIVPYLAQRHGQRPINEMELRGLVTFVLQELYATDLPGQEYNWLCSRMVDLMRELLRQPVRQLALTGAEDNWLTRQGMQPKEGTGQQPAVSPQQRPARAAQRPLTPPPPPELDEMPTEPTLPITPEQQAQVGRQLRPNGVNAEQRPGHDDSRRWRFPVPRLPRDQRRS